MRRAGYARRSPRAPAKPGPAPVEAGGVSPAFSLGDVPARPGDPAPAAVADALQAPGRSLDPAARATFEPRFGMSFADVRIHADAAADRAARAIDARAFTVGGRIGFAASEYAPATPSGQRLLAHELAHVAQAAGQSEAAATVRRTPQAPAAAPAPPAPPAPPAVPPPRLDYVFIMGPIGASRNDFYRRANAFYQARLPSAIFVTTETSLTGVLDYLAANAVAPAANIYIVSHGNEDGTFTFGLDPADADGHMDIGELRSRLHPAGGGPSTLADVSTAVDAATRIHIKGCDIGRTGEMVELIDESFGGAGTVTAPTHEQVYEWDVAAGAAARTREQTRLIGEFTATLPPVPAVPPPVDRSLRGPALAAARAERTRLLQERAAAERQRSADIAAETARIQPDLDVFEERAAVAEELSGPMFQRPGTTRFVAADIRPEVDRLYPHLSARQRTAMVRALIRPGTAPHAATGDVTGLRGQQVFRVNATQSAPFPDPQNLAETIALLGGQMPPHFVPTAFLSTTRSADNIRILVEGTLSEPGEPPRTATVPIDQPFSSDAELIAEGREAMNNPGRYSWRVVESHHGGQTTRDAIAERVVAYLHHEELSPGALPPFNPAESDPDFYATSTFAPPPPPPPQRTP